MDDDILNRVQTRLLDMGKNIVQILEKHNIDYCIIFGTLLGSVRHRGYIPWDDDFDLLLFDDTYNQAIEFLRNELPGDMIVEDKISEPLYFHSWAHVKDLNTIAEFSEYPQDNLYSHKGLSIDLYKATKMKEKEIDNYRAKENISYYQRLFNLHIIDKTELEQKIEKINKNLFELNSLSNQQDREAYALVVNERIIYPEEIFPLKKFVFEKNYFLGPNNPDSLLTRFYGDYMTLPPEGKRIQHYTNVIFLNKL